MDAIGLLGELISIDSVFQREKRIGEFLEGRLRELGFSTSRQGIAPDRFNVLAGREGEGECLMLYGHMDTVPPYGKWESDPFRMREDGDRLYGLGSWDMKSGIGAILKAVEKTGRSVKVAFGCDEENISEGAHAMVRSGFMDDVSAVVVAESGLNEKGISGPGMITLGRRGRAVYSFEVEGRSAHGGDVRSGLNAVTEASRLAIALEEMNPRLKRHELLPPQTQFVRKLSGETDSLSIPERAYLELDRHLVPPDTPEKALEGIEAEIAKMKGEGTLRAGVKAYIKPRKTPYLAPYVTPRDDPHVVRMSRIVRERLGSEPVYNYALSVADENILATKKPVITIGTSGANEHAANEWVSKKSYLDLIGVLGEFLSSRP
jgi:acetylornithine deacetylase/succinyl-diaminopimelate desuccinylase-like protein